MKIIDRYVVSTLLLSFLISLVGLLAMFVLVDTLENFEDFSEYASKSKDVNVLQIWAHYYLVRLPLMYVQLAPAVMLVASMFASTLMVRNNELVPLLACGVSAYRVMRIHLFVGVACALSMMAVQEWVIPPLAGDIQKGRVAISGAREQIDNVQLFDGQGRVFYMGQIQQFKQRVLLVHVVERHPETGRRAMEIDAAMGDWVDTPSGGMLLTLRDGVIRRFDAGMSQLPGYPRSFAGDDVIELETDLPAADMIEPEKVNIEAARTARELYELTRDDPENKRFADLMALHLRFSVPLSAIVLLVLGLPLFLGTGNRNFWLGAMVCIIVAAAYYLALLGGINLGNKALLRPGFAAWAPVALFASLGLASLKGVRT